MAERAPASDDLVQLAVAAAICAVPPMGSDAAGWMSRINVAIPHVAAMLDEHSLQSGIARKVLDASVFTSIFHGYEIEESSTRAIVTLIKNDAGEMETIRTERTDNANGRAIVDRLSRLQSGQRVRIWKAVEEMSGRADRKVRVLVHLELLRSQDPAERPTPSAAQQAGVSAPPRSSPPSSGAGAEAPTTAVAAIKAALADMPTDKRAKIVEALRKKGWATAAEIPVDKQERALYMVLHDGEEPF